MVGRVEPSVEWAVPPSLRRSRGTVCARDPCVCRRAPVAPKTQWSLTNFAGWMVGVSEAEGGGGGGSEGGSSCGAESAGVCILAIVAVGRKSNDRLCNS